MQQSMGKKVYIFGAGASVAAGLPIQCNLLNSILSLDEPPRISMDNFMALDTYSVMLINHYPYFEKSRRRLCDFIINNFGNHELRNLLSTLFSIHNVETVFEYDLHDNEINNKWRILFARTEDINVALEDLFTLFDKASLLKEYFGTYSVQEIDDIQEKLYFCIVYSISTAIQNTNNILLYENLSKYLVDNRLNAKLEESPFSIITLNWDTLLDNYIYQACKNNNTTNKKKHIFPDYCCYNYDINSEMPSTHIKATGKYNIKIMKLHGSINWLICSNCGRLYTDFLKNITLQCTDSSSKPVKCNFCESMNRKYDLRHILITPTFLKDFSTLQLKNIWHNAYLDLCKATEVFFIGYSFPDADFELRYILKRAIKPEAQIKVVLHTLDNPEEHRKCIRKNCSSQSKIYIENRLDLPCKRYESFFNNHDIEFYYEGIEKAFNEKFIY